MTYQTEQAGTHVLVPLDDIKLPSYRSFVEHLIEPGVDPKLLKREFKLPKVTRKLSNPSIDKIKLAEAVAD